MARALAKCPCGGNEGRRPVGAVSPPHSQQPKSQLPLQLRLVCLFSYTSHAHVHTQLPHNLTLQRSDTSRADVLHKADYRGIQRSKGPFRHLQSPSLHHQGAASGPVGLDRKTLKLQYSTLALQNAVTVATLEVGALLARYSYCWSISNGLVSL